MQQHISSWSYNEESFHLVKQHANQCKMWDQHNIKLPLLAVYVTFLTKHLQIFDHECTTILLLHRYVKQANGFLPESMNALLRFKQTGVIAVKDIQNIQHYYANEPNTCGICNQVIAVGDPVFIFSECNHLFHIGNPKCKHSLAAWLQTTNVCPFPNCNKTLAICSVDITSTTTTKTTAVSNGTLSQPKQKNLIKT